MQKCERHLDGSMFHDDKNALSHTVGCPHLPTVSLPPRLSSRLALCSQVACLAFEPNYRFSSSMQAYMHCAARSGQFLPDASPHQ